VDCCGVHPVFFIELGGKITFLRCYENVLTGNHGRYEQDETPRKIKGERDSCQKANTAKVERVP
jgi:hypothetical protein